ncbi:hypothetical protein E1N52_40220 [Paraburkholderia guartelaensis]|uniref:Uncharacterized protein n=1 Tax=Paraburkholderia guartelaensis TaxID=2546446 RepID=A0A4R5L3V1_9BURK|nr:type IV toxin-antitoxin system AbiEi family antitoxin [Paraburkholderia guartelaensis]TDG02323.1 hypothetical protein E1N52_40220 [Paraburkholderia guartelaensis]
MKAVTDRLSASGQTALSLACEAFSDATRHFSASPRFDAPARPDDADALVHFSVAGRRFDMPVVFEPRWESSFHTVHRHTPAKLGATADDRRLMVITYHVTPKVAAEFIARRIPFMDTAGNVYLDEPEATIMIVGRDKPALKPTDTSSRSTTPKGLRVTFALACQPGLVEQPMRTIAAESGVALNTVNLAVDDLIARGLVIKKATGERVIADRRRFIADWVSQYPTALRKKLGARRFTSGVGIEWWKGAPLSDFDARLGGECAADVLTREIKPASVTVYVHAGVSTALMKAARLRPNAQGEVEILESFWPTHAEESWDVRPGIVHPLLIYADLIASGDSRNHAVAQSLHDRFLAS